MKKLFVVMVLILFFLQFSIFPIIFSQLRLNVLLLLVISMALVYPCRFTLPLAFGTGILIDTFSVSGFGLYSICFLVTSFSLDAFRRSVLPARKGMVLVGGVFVATLIFFDLLLFMVNLIFLRFGLSLRQADFLSQGIGAYFIQLMASLAVALPLYYCLDRIDRALGSGRLDLKLINH